MPDILYMLVNHDMRIESAAPTVSEGTVPDRYFDD